MGLFFNYNVEYEKYHLILIKLRFGINAHGFTEVYNQMIKIKLAQAPVITAPMASLHLFLFQKASFFILLVYI
jgi:hypothetical protein